MHQKTSSTILLSLALFMLIGCSKPAEVKKASTPDRLSVFTTIAPQYFACKEMLSDKDTITNSCPIGEDSADYLPERDVLSKMIASDLIVINGADFEQWLPRVSLPDSITLNTALNFKNEWLHYDEEKTHSHGEKGAHSHKGINGHTWLAPKFYKKQCEAIYKRLKQVLGDEEAEKRKLTKRHSQLQLKLDGINKLAAESWSPLKGKTIAATHPSYDYIAKQFGFSVFNVMIDPDADKINDELLVAIKKLKHEMSSKEIKYILWESEPSAFVKKAIGTLGIKNIIFEPLESMDKLDYIVGMEENYKRLSAALK